MRSIQANVGLDVNYLVLHKGVSRETAFHLASESFRRFAGGNPWNPHSLVRLGLGMASGLPFGRGRRVSLRVYP